MPTYDLRTVPGRGTVEEAHAVRRTVFIEEQDVSEAEEMDGRDDDADHVVVVDESADRPVATARLRVVDGHGKAERVAVLQAYRGEGLGKRVMAVLESMARRKGIEEMHLNAQTHVEGFYADLGYETVSDVFYEADIPHVEMRKAL
jgi:predicted GNAT family N-acyltransferase